MSTPPMPYPRTSSAPPSQQSGPHSPAIMPMQAQMPQQPPPGYFLSPSGFPYQSGGYKPGMMVIQQSVLPYYTGHPSSVPVPAPAPTPAPAPPTKEELEKQDVAAKFRNAALSRLAGKGTSTPEAAPAPEAVKPEPVVAPAKAEEDVREKLLAAAAEKAKKEKAAAPAVTPAPAVVSTPATTAVRAAPAPSSTNSVYESSVPAALFSPPAASLTVSLDSETISGSRLERADADKIAKEKSLLASLRKSKIVHQIEELTARLAEVLQQTVRIEWPKDCVRHKLVEPSQPRTNNNMRGGDRGRHDQGRRRGGRGGPDMEEDPGELYNILHRSDAPYRPRKADELDQLTVVTRQAIGILNKISRETFAKLSEEMLNLNITSQDMLEKVIDAVFDKALEDVFFQDLHADLCKKLGDKAVIWSDRYLRVAHFDKDRGTAGEGWYVDTSGNPSQPQWIGPYASETEAQSEGRRLTSFKRLLLNRCQQEFLKDAQYRPIDIEQAEDEEAKAKGLAAGTWNDEKEKEFATKSAARASARQKIKRRMLANISFIGHLYKIEGMLTAPIMYFCVQKLIGTGDEPDEESVEAFCKLITLIGEKLEKEEATAPPDNRKLPQIMEMADQKLARSPKLSMRIQFAVRDVLDLRKDGWKLKGAKASLERQAITLTRQELHRKAEEDRRASEQSALASSQAARLSGIAGGRGSAGGSQRPVATPAGRGGRGPATFGPKSSRPGPAAANAKASPLAGTPSAASPGDGWTTVTGKARGAEVEAAPVEVKAEALTGDALKKALQRIVTDYSAHQSTEQLENEVKEIAPSVGWSGVLLQDVLRGGLSAAPAFRESAGKVIAHLGKTGMLNTNEAVTAFSEFMQSYSDLSVDSPKIADYTAQIVGPAVAEGVITLKSLIPALQAGVASGSITTLFAHLVNAAVGADKPAHAAVVGELKAGQIPFASFVLPGRNRVKKFLDQLAPARNADTSLFPELDAAAAARTRLEGFVGSGDASGADAMVAFIHELPDGVKKSKEFARLVFADVVELAKAEGDPEALKSAISSATTPLRVCLRYAESADESAEDTIGAYVLNGLQITIASDDSCGPEFYLAAFQALHESPDPVIKSNMLVAWAGDEVVEPVGRDAALSAVAPLLENAKA